MLHVNSNKQFENEENTITVNIIGRLDCPKVTLCKQIAQNIAKNSKFLIRFEFQIEFETQFELLREKLLKEDLEILSIESSPIIYYQKAKSNKKVLIGSLDQYLRWLIKNYEYFEDSDYNTLTDLTRENLKKYVSLSKNKYCYFEISIDGQIQEKVIFELFHDKCPITCNNFLSLCRGVKISNSSDFLSYQNTFIHRIAKNGYIQGGDLNYLKSNVHKSIYNGEFPDENYDVPHSDPGILGMVKKGNRKHSNECQFYITLTPLQSFNGQYVAFGRIVQGFKTIRQIEKIETYLQRPKSKVKIEKSGEYII